MAVPLGGLVNLDGEKERLSDEMAAIDGNLQKLGKRLQDRKFLERAPEEVVERERQRLATMQARRSRVEEVLSRLS